MSANNMLLAALVLVLPLFILFHKNLLFRAKSNDLPPGPSAWQLLANISELGKKPHVAFANLSKVYGPIMSLRLGSQLLVIASTSEAAKEILKTHDRNFSGRYMPGVYYKVPRAVESSIGMLKECNETWKFLRGISQNFIFSSKSVESKADLRNAKVEEMVKYLRSKEGEIVNLEDVMSANITNIISNMLVSRDLYDIRGEAKNDEKVKALVDEFVEMVSHLGLSDLFPVLKRVDFWSRQKGREIYRNIMCVWGDMVKERRASWRNNNDISARDLSDILMENGLSDDRISIIFMELLMAGTLTTIVTSIWLMVELIKHPDILHKVRDEILKAFQGDMLINESILTESRYFQACMKETLRLHNPGPLLLPHRAIERCNVNNYVIPKDSVVLINTWAYCMESESWKDAKSFKPERFLGLEIDFRGTHFELIPFGAGRRMCPGLNVAIKNIQVMVASLVHYFEWSLPNGIDPKKIDMSEKFGTILRKEEPLYLIPSLRK